HSAVSVLTSLSSGEASVNNFVRICACAPAIRELLRERAPKLPVGSEPQNEPRKRLLKNCAEISARNPDPSEPRPIGSGAAKPLPIGRGSKHLFPRGCLAKLAEVRRGVSIVW